MLKYSIAIRSTKPGTKKANITETKAYPVYQSSGIVTLSELARHMATHGSTFGRGDILGVLTQMVDCIRHELLDGKSVQLGELGTLSPNFKVTGAASASTVTAGANIQKVTVKYRAGAGFADLRSEAEFECVPSREAQKLAVAEARAQETLQSESSDSGNTGGSSNTGGGNTGGGNTGGGSSDSGEGLNP